MPAPTIEPGVPLRKIPPLFLREAAKARRAALAASKDPDEAWRAFQAARRESKTLPFRALAWLDDHYRTDAPEILDRDDTPPEVRRQLLRKLDVLHQRLGTYPQFCALVRPLLAGKQKPRVLEIASGHGQLSIALEADLRAAGIDAEVIGSDYKQELVDLARENAARSGSRATFELLDATKLDVEADSFELSMNVFVMHHFPFAMVVQALRELRRVARQAVIVDLARSPVLYAPGGFIVAAITRELGCVHDGMLSLRKAWGVEEWKLAIALAGWERSRIGFLAPASLVVQLER